MSKNDKLTYYSLLSGEIYEVEEDEIENLDQFQIPLLKGSKNGCKKCFERGYIGYDSMRKYYPMCKCIIKNIDRDRIQKQIDLKY